MLFAVEAGLTLISLREGWFRSKAAGWRWCVANADWIRRHRRRLQAGRTVPDRDLAVHLTPVLDPGMVELPRGSGS